VIRFIKAFSALATVVVPLTFVVGAVGQAKAISDSKFYGAYRAALAANQTAPWKSVENGETLEGGKVVSSTKEIVEVVSWDIRHRLRSESLDGKTTTSESIRIGKNYYCREDATDWKKSDGPCGSEHFRTIPADNRSEASFQNTRFNGKPFRLYEINYSYRDFDGVERFSRQKIWIGFDGRLYREESSVGTVATKETTSRYTVVYEHDLRSLKIVSPIN
jgi:hypothetical protein